jgi:hypothetical protein
MEYQGEKFYAVSLKDLIASKQAAGRKSGQKD